MSACGRDTRLATGEQGLVGAGVAATPCPRFARDRPREHYFDVVIEGRPLTQRETLSNDLLETTCFGVPIAQAFIEAFDFLVTLTNE